MPKNDKAHKKKVAAAVNALMRFPGMKVHEAMDYAQFSKKVMNDVNVRHLTPAAVVATAERDGSSVGVGVGVGGVGVGGRGGDGAGGWGGRRW